MADPYLTPAQLRGRVSALESKTKFPDADLAEYVDEFEHVAEDYRKVAFVPRTSTYEITGYLGGVIVLPRPKVRSVTSFTVAGIALDSTTYALHKHRGVIEGTPGIGIPVSSFGATVEITYAHGYDSPPPTVLRACREYVRACALSDRTSIGRDVVTQADGAGGYTRFSTPDKAAGRPTGWLEVDRLLNSAPDFSHPGVA